MTRCGAGNLACSRLFRRLSPLGSGSAGWKARPTIKLGFVLLAAVFASSCSREPLPVLGQAPVFQLTAQNGQAFSSQSLAGHVWVANFIFTTCTGPCPMMSSQMRRIQNSTAGSPEIRLVSFTVDPAHDTPPVLAAYAANFTADPKRWFFLTGQAARLDDIAYRSFHLNRVDGSLDHSTRFVLVDRQGRIRGYYSSEEDGFLKRLLADVKRLDREKS